MDEQSRRETWESLTDAQKIAVFDYLYGHGLLPFTLTGVNRGISGIGFVYAGMYHGIEPDGYIHT